MPIQHKTYSRITNADTIVLFVHGIQGSPLQFQYMVSALPGCIDYMCILLPGHGETVRSFRSVGRKDWTTYFQDLCCKLQKQYKSIYFVGHSLGCLIGIDAACGGRVEFEGMLLLACPLKIKLSLRYIATCYQAIKDEKPSSKYVLAARNANSVFLRHPLELITCPKPYFGLLLMIMQSHRDFKFLTSKVCLIQSEKDEIVSSKSAKAVSVIPNGHAVIVPESGHFYYSPSAQKIILQELRNLLHL